MRGRALQERDLIPNEDKRTYTTAIDCLRERLDPGGRTLAVQDLRHASLERHFRIAYGRDGLSVETRNALLHSQLQEGLNLELMKASSVSGSETYPALCLAAKNEEHRLAEMKKRQLYRKSNSNQPQNPDSFNQTITKSSDRRPPFTQVLEIEVGD